MIGGSLPAASGLVAVLAGISGCTGDGDSPFVPLRPVLPFFVTDSNPQNLAQGVPTSVVIDVGFSDVPFPPDLAGSWTLASFAVRYTGLARADLVDRRVRVRAARGLEVYWEYTLTLAPTLHSFAGVALPGKATVDFVTGGGPGDAVTDPPARALAADVLPALAGCASASCHTHSASADGLDLETAEGVAAAVGRSSRDQPGSALVVPSDHAQSYLVWKALGLPHTVGHQEPALSHDAARVLADWIDEGARND